MNESERCKRARQLADGLCNSLRITAPIDRDAVACVVDAGMSEAIAATPTPTLSEVLALAKAVQKCKRAGDYINSGVGKCQHCDLDSNWICEICCLLSCVDEAHTALSAIEQEMTK